MPGRRRDSSLNCRSKESQWACESVQPVTTPDPEQAPHSLERNRRTRTRPVPPQVEQRTSPIGLPQTLHSFAILRSDIGMDLNLSTGGAPCAHRPNRDEDELSEACGPYVSATSQWRLGGNGCPANGPRHCSCRFSRAVWKEPGVLQANGSLTGLAWRLNSNKDASQTVPRRSWASC